MEREQKTKSIAIIALVGGLLGAGAIGVAALSLGGALAPSGKLTAAALEDETCVAQVQKAVSEISTEVGITEDIQRSHAVELGRNGHLRLTQALAGTRYEFDFGIETECRVKLYRRKMKEPGHMQSNQGDFGSRTLSDPCTCEEQRDEG